MLLLWLPLADGEFWLLIELAGGVLHDVPLLPGLLESERMVTKYRNIIRQALWLAQHFIMVWGYKP